MDLESLRHLLDLLEFDDPEKCAAEMGASVGWLREPPIEFIGEARGLVGDAYELEWLAGFLYGCACREAAEKQGA